MGVAKGNEKGSSKIIQDVVSYARGAGWGHHDKTELQQVAVGTHKDMFVDKTIGRNVLAVCPKWRAGVLAPLADKVEEMLMDGEDVAPWICIDHLEVCPPRKDKDEL